MKRLLIFALLLTLTVGCKDTLLITTTVNEDGSLIRTLSTAADSSGLPTFSYPIPSDDSWQTVIEPDTGDGAFRYTFSKHFSSWEELNRELDCRRDTIKVNNQVSLDRRFRWVFTYYRFEETLFAVNPFTLVPIEGFLSPEEIDFYYAQKDTLGINEKTEEWMLRSIFESYYRVLLASVENRNLPLTTAQIEASKEELVDAVRDWDILEEPFGAFFLEKADSLLTIAPTLKSLQNDFAETDSTLNRYLQFQMAGSEEYEFTVIMPGRIINANADRLVDKNTAQWRVNTESFNDRDVVMWVESRRLNVPAAVVSALAVTGVGVFMWIAAVRARRRRRAELGLSPADAPMWVLARWLSVLCVVVGFALVAFFGWLYLIFYSPQFLGLHVLPSGERLLFIALMALGVVLAVFGSVHLLRWRRMQKSTDAVSEPR